MSFFRFRKKRGVPVFSPARPRRLLNPFFPKKNTSHWQNTATQASPPKRAVSDSWNIFFALILLFASTLLFFNYLPHWRITDLSVNGTQHLSVSEIESLAKNYMDQKRFFFLRGDNALLLRTGDMQNFIREKVSEKFALEDVRVEKVEAHSLRIQVVERTPKLVWVSGNEYFYIDPQGIAIQKTDPNVVDPSFPKVFDYNNLPVELNSPVISEDLTRMALSFYDDYKNADFFETRIDSFFIPPVRCSEEAVVEKHVTLEDLAATEIAFATEQRKEIQERLQKGEITVEESLALLEQLDSQRKYTNKDDDLLTPEEYQETSQNAPQEKILFEEVSVPTNCNLAIIGHDLGVKTEGKWSAYFTDRTELETQLKNIQLLLSEKFSGSAAKIQYVDVRFSEKVFYKEVGVQ